MHTPQFPGLSFPLFLFFGECWVQMLMVEQHTPPPFPVQFPAPFPVQFPLSFPLLCPGVDADGGAEHTPIKIPILIPIFPCYSHFPLGAHADGGAEHITPVLSPVPSTIPCAIPSVFPAVIPIFPGAHADRAVVWSSTQCPQFPAPFPVSFPFFQVQTLTE